MLIFCLFINLPISAEPLKGGVSILDSLPAELYGSWQVSSVLTYTSDKSLFPMPGIDFWNIYRSGNVLTLENPLTSARASVEVSSVENNTVTFNRRAKNKNEETVESPTITIVGENFWGTDKMIIKKYENGTLVKTNMVEFTIIGKKIGGQSIKELLY